MTFQRFTPDDDARLTQLQAQGLGFAQIAEVMHRSRNSVIGRAHRLSLPSRESPITHVSDETREKIRTMCRTGMSGGEIARRVGVSEAFVHNLRNSERLPRWSGNPCAVAPRPARKEPEVIIPSAAQIPLPVAPPSNVIPFPAPAPAQLYRSCQAIVDEPRGRSCQWPMEKLPGRRWRFCDSLDVVPGKPYCAEHAGVAYVRKPQVAEAAD